MSQKFEQFGKYLLLEKLATGGMAEVFLARANAAGGIAKFVAIKRILPQYADSPEFIEMFKDEAKIAVNLNHSNVVSIYDFGVQNKQFYLVMDYVEGRNLRQILNKLKKGGLRLQIDQIVYIIKEVCSGLDHAHRCHDGATGKPLNITHRDMSPQNVMISFEGEVKIVDFGIAKAESQIETTRAGTLKGKFGYMSPEQAEGQTVDLRTDIFSLGTVLWELLANDRLFIASNELNTLRKIRDCQIPSLRKINPNIPAELERITMKALARDRNLRYQTAAAMHRDLNRFLNRHYPEFSTQDFASFIKAQFSEEIFSTRQRLIEYARIPSGSTDETGGGSLKADDRLIPRGATGKDSLLSNNTSSFISGDAESNEPDNGTPTNTGPVPHPTNSDLKNTPEKANDFFDREFSFGQAGSGKAPTGNEGATRVATAKPTEQTTNERHLDERAIKRELTRARIYAYSGDLDSGSQPSISSRTRYGTHTGIFHTRRRRMLPRQAMFTSLLILTGLSFYTYLAKSQTEMMMPLVVALDPYIRPFHELVGIKEGQQSSGSHLPQPPPQPVQTRPEPIARPTPRPQPEPKPEEESDPAPLSPSEPKDTLLVTSTPSGAEILVNGRPTGNLTPSKVEVPASREFSITLRRMGYLDYRRARLSRTSAGSRISGTLQPALVGYLDIDVVPPQNARVYINGRELKGEHLPITGYAVPAETPVTVRAENPILNKAVQQVVKVPKDRRLPVLLDLRKGSRSDRQPSQSR